jgi:hypothetical protein
MVASNHAKQSRKPQVHTTHVFAGSDKEAALKGAIPNFKIQSVTRIHDNFYHVRNVATKDFNKLHNGYKGVASRRVI